MKECILVNVSTDYLSDESSADNDRYVFINTIEIKNSGKHPVKLIARHWVIEDSNGHVESVANVDVTGEQPTIAPDDSFTYRSGTVIETEIGTVSGLYSMIDHQGEHFDVPVEAFLLSTPRTLH